MRDLVRHDTLLMDWCSAFSYHAPRCVRCIATCLLNGMLLLILDILLSYKSWWVFCGQLDIWSNAVRATYDTPKVYEVCGHINITWAWMLMHYAFTFMHLHSWCLTSDALDLPMRIGHTHPMMKERMYYRNMGFVDHVFLSFPFSPFLLLKHEWSITWH